MKKTIVLSCVIFVMGGLLSACSTWYSVNAAPSAREQCLGLKRQKVFLRDNTTASADAYHLQQKSMYLDRQYRDLRCDQVLSEPAAKKKTTKK